MNKKGKAFVRKYKNRYLNPGKNGVSDEVQEMMMRVGRECKFFEAEGEDDIKMIATACLMKQKMARVAQASDLEEWIKNNPVIIKRRSWFSNIFSFFKKLSLS